MKTRHLARWAGACTRAVALSALVGLAAADATRYERMAPLEQYLMPSAAEIALARSAAPAAISDQATVLTLDSKGYQTAARGTNGFTCLVERSWMAPFQNPDFWNPKIRAPICYNPAASRSILAWTLRRTKLALAADSKEGILEEVRAAVARNEFPSPEPGAMSFMMSKDMYLGDDVGHWHSHLMFHVPKVAGASWGANLPGSPVILDDREVPEPQTIFMVPVSRWSDGTTAAAH
ncbi:MAG TPA: hypothetical protein VIH60_08800 [Steroidobacteraceae bacterium]|jgi:hypothetical protein